MYRKLYVDECVDIVCNAVKVQSPLTLEQLCQIIQENLPGSCVPKDNLKEDARLVILDDSSFTIEYANTVPETKLLFSISFRQSTTSIGATHRMGVGECHTTYWFLIYSCTICKLFSLTVVTK